MRKLLTYLLLLALTLSCSHRAKVIPMNEFSEIYVDLFMMDEWLLKHRQDHVMLDTSMVYQPVLEKYGYTVDDYVNSMSYYMKDTERYTRILRNSATIINSRVQELEFRKDIQMSLDLEKERVMKFAPDTIFFLSGIHNDAIFRQGNVSFYVDSTGGQWNFDPQAGLDTFYRGPMLIARKKDTLALNASDSLIVDKTDSSFAIGETTLFRGR